MATYNPKDMTTIYHVKVGKWQVIACPGVEPPIYPSGAFNVGDECEVSGAVKMDGVCYECVGYVAAYEIKKLNENGSNTVYAKMTLYFDENGGGAVSDKTVYFDKAYGTLPVTAKTGYTFNGWFTDETWGTQVTEATIVSNVSDHTLHAKLDINYYTITFKNYAGVTVSTQNIAYGTTPSVPAGTPDTAQYDYSWPSVSPASADVTYQETRTVKSYLIIWKSYAGATLKSEVLNYGATSTAPTGTSDTAQYDYSWPKSSTTVTGAETITETRALRYYTVTWKDWDGTTLKTESVAYGGNGTPPTQPTRTGYTFSNWTGDYTGITGNVTVTATYNLNNWQLTISTIVGIDTQTVNRTSSPNAGASTGAIGHGDPIYYGDVLTFSATADNGYSVVITGSPHTVNGAVATATFIDAEYNPNQPLITYTGKTAFSMSFTVKNQAPYNVRIYYRAGGVPTTSNNDGYIDVPAGGTSLTQEIDGLIPSTSYNIYAIAYIDGIYSPSVYFTQTTNNLSAPSVWYDYSKTSNSITMRVYNPNPVAVTLYYAVNQNPPTANSTTVNANSYKDVTISGLSASTTYTVYGRFAYSGKYSATVSDSATTNAAVKTWVYITWDTADPGLTPDLVNYNATPSNCAALMEADYPAAWYNVGQYGQVDDDNGFYMILEVQLV